jgi:hypothetical protein
MQPDTKTVHVEERQAQDQAVLAFPTPGDAQCLGAGEEVPVREQRALGPSRRTRRVGQQSRVVGPDRVQIDRGALGQFDADVGDHHARVGVASERTQLRGLDDRRTRFRVGHDHFELAARVRAVDRYGDESGAQYRAVSDDEVDRGRARHQHSVP